MKQMLTFVDEKKRSIILVIGQEDLLRVIVLNKNLSHFSINIKF